MTGARRVVVIDHTGQLGGGEIAMMRLLLALDPSWDVTVLLLADGAFRSELERNGLPVDVLPLAERTATQNRAGLTDPAVLMRTGRDSLEFARTLAAKLRSLAPDLVVANTLKAAVLTELATRITRIPWVWHLHDRLSPDYLPTPVVSAMRMLAWTPRRVVANSVDVAVLTRLPARRLAVAYPGLPAAAYRDHHTSPEQPVFGLLGRISPTKGQREFIAAAALMADEFPTARFRIVGEALFTDQPYADEVRTLPDRLGVGDRVEFAGWANDPRAAIDGFTALVHASPVPEPFGQVIVEAMARQVPVVATLGGGVGEILRAPRGARLGDGAVLSTAVGQLVGPEDPEALASAMATVLRDPVGTTARAHAAYDQAVARFSSRVTAATAATAWEAAL